MRCTQVMGLSEESERFLDDNVEIAPEKLCPTCGHSEGGTRVCEVYDTDRGRLAGMLDDGPDLYRYKLTDGSWVKEIVQASISSSGPCIFLCLEKEDKTRIGEWSKESIEGC